MNNNTPPQTETDALPSQESASQESANQVLDPKLLELLVCPKTKGPLEYDPEAGELISRKAALAYPIRNGLPIMLVSEARELKS